MRDIPLRRCGVKSTLAITAASTSPFAVVVKALADRTCVPTKGTGAAIPKADESRSW